MAFTDEFRDAVLQGEGGDAEIGHSPCGNRRGGLVCPPLHSSYAAFMVLREIREFVMLRCFRDPEVASILLRKLKESDSADEWTTYPWLLRSSALENIEHELREWAEKRWKDACESDWWVFGFNLFQCKSVPLKETLLELLLT